MDTYQMVSDYMGIHNCQEGLAQATVSQWRHIE